MLAEVDITIGDVIIYIVAGLVIGVIARALLPGRQSMSIVMTIVIGVIAAVVGGLLWEDLPRQRRHRLDRFDHRGRRAGLVVRASFAGRGRATTD